MVEREFIFIDDWGSSDDPRIKLVGCEEGDEICPGCECNCYGFDGESFYGEGPADHRAQVSERVNEGFGWGHHVDLAYHILGWFFM